MPPAKPRNPRCTRVGDSWYPRVGEGGVGEGRRRANRWSFADMPDNCGRAAFGRRSWPTSPILDIPLSPTQSCPVHQSGAVSVWERRASSQIWRASVGRPLVGADIGEGGAFKEHRRETGIRVKGRWMLNMKPIVGARGPAVVASGRRESWGGCVTISYREL